MPHDVRAPAIDAYGDGGFRIGGVRKDGATLIFDGAARAWRDAPGNATALTPEHFSDLLNAQARPDMVVLGAGERLTHPPAAVRKAFRDAGIGLEVMDTGSACRAYNLLAGEARRVYAALLPV
ncbi:Mth938-like domain-containing protein [Hyphomonadaceae bacterium BL14]|nr:Mth938-like domain-containing protein [Hyphomonadaceae bacterium BL14]